MTAGQVARCEVVLGGHGAVEVQDHEVVGVDAGAGTRDDVVPRPLVEDAVPGAQITGQGVVFLQWSNVLGRRLPPVGVCLHSGLLYPKARLVPVPRGALRNTKIAEHYCIRTTCIRKCCA